MDQFTHQGAINAGIYASNIGYCAPQGPNEPSHVYQTRVNAFDFYSNGR